MRCAYCHNPDTWEMNTGTEMEILIYTGYRLEELPENAAMQNLLSQIDVLIDGPFIEELKDTKLHWRGSSNQKIYRKVNGEWRVDNEDSGMEGRSHEAGECGW